jgi:hypothetical protein
MVDEMVARLVGHSEFQRIEQMVLEMAERRVGTMDRWRVEKMEG